MISQTSGLFTFQQDDYSIKVLSSNDPLFFVRYDIAASSDQMATFSDVIFGEQSVGAMATALSELDYRYGWIAFKSRIECRDIQPNHVSEGDYTRIVLMHDRICAAVRRALVECGVKVVNSFLEPRGFKMDSVILLECDE